MISQIGQLLRSMLLDQCFKVICSSVFATSLIAANCYAADANSIQFNVKITEPNRENDRPVYIALITENDRPTMFMQTTALGDMVAINRTITSPQGSESLKYRSPDISSALTIWPVIKPSGKIDTALIFDATTKRGHVYVSTSVCDSIELEDGVLYSFSADAYLIDITANYINLLPDDNTSDVNPKEESKKL